MLTGLSISENEMKPNSLCKTLYLGDRSCLSLIWNEQLRNLVIEVDLISRIRSQTGEWEYYTGEDIESGRLVFFGVVGLRSSPESLVPNDSINFFECNERNDGMLACKFSISHVSENGDSTEVSIEFVAEDFALEDPKNPGVYIRE